MLTNKPSVLFLLCLSTALLMAGCKKQVIYELGVPFEMKIGDSVRAQADGPSILFQKIQEDSRCPAKANCLWEGQAIIILADAAGEADQIDVTMRKGHPDMAVGTMGGYSIQLLKVSPYPESGVKIEDKEYVIELRIDKA